MGRSLRIHANWECGVKRREFERNQKRACYRRRVGLGIWRPRRWFFRFNFGLVPSPSMAIPLEDYFADIIGKAQRGLGSPTAIWHTRAGLPVEAVQRCARGISMRMRRGGGAGARAQCAGARRAGRNAYAPAEIGEFDGLAQFNTPFDDMTVNAYLAWDPVSEGCRGFRYGRGLRGHSREAQIRGAQLRYIFLTHTHGDHVFDLDRLKEQTGAPAFVSSREPIEGAEAFDAGKEFWVGTLRIGTRLTWGHSRGAITWIVSGLRRPVAWWGRAFCRVHGRRRGELWRMRCGRIGRRFSRCRMTRSSARAMGR